MGLLKRQLSSSRQRRRDIFIENDVTEGKHILMSPNLKRRLNQNQTPAVFLDVQLLQQRIRLNACYPDDAGGMNLGALVIVFERDGVAGNLHYAGLGKDFDAVF